MSGIAEIAVKEVFSLIKDALTKKSRIIDNWLEALVNDGKLSSEGKVVVKQLLEQIGKPLEKLNKLFVKLTTDNSKFSKKDDDELGTLAVEVDLRLAKIGKYTELDTFIEGLINLFYTTDFKMNEMIYECLADIYKLLCNKFPSEYGDLKWSQSFLDRIKA